MAASDSVAAAKRSYAWEPRIVRRLRHRRLFSFLACRGFGDAFRALMQETDEHLCVIHLRELVEEGQWDGAARYLSRFLPPPSDPWSFDAQVLYEFVDFIGNCAKIAAGDKDVMDKLNRSASHSELWRATLDWVRLRSVAANMVEEMACRTPEFSRALRLPGGRFVRPHNVLPLWPSFRRRRHMKTHSRPAPSAVASALLRKKFWQDFCISHKSDQYSVGLSREANETVKTKLRRCLCSAKRLDVNYAELQRQFQLPLNRKEGLEKNQVEGKGTKIAISSGDGGGSQET